MKPSRILGLFALLLLPVSLFAAPLLVDSDWLQQHMHNKGIVIVDMSSDYTQHQRFHIPGAVYLPYAELNRAGRDRVSYAIPSQQLQQLLGYLGIEANSHIVIYDDMGGLNASRLFWQLEQLGHPEVSLLDGGLVSWIRKGLPITGEISTPKQTRYVAPQITTGNLASLEQVIAATGKDSISLLDARSSEEYAGDPRYPRSGHVPGAISYPWDNSVDFEHGFTLKRPQQIASLLQQAGLDKDTAKPVITYCQSGHRAAHVYFSLRLLGYKRIKLYDGSMAEYAMHPEAPLRMGTRPN